MFGLKLFLNKHSFPFSSSCSIQPSIADSPGRAGYLKPIPLIKMKKQASIVSSPIKQITVLLAEDHAGFRKSLKVLVELDGDIDVVGEAKNGREAMQMAMSLQPQVIIMDIAMPLLNGLQAT